MEWISDNWPILVGAVLFVIERVTGVSGEWKRRAHAMVVALDAFSQGGAPVLPQAVKSEIEARLGGKGSRDNKELGDVIERATGEAKHKRSRARRFGTILLKCLPIVSRFVP